MTSGQRKRYIPALERDWLTPLYDPLLRLTMPERKFRIRLIGQARIAAGQRVLDLGCGTGTLAVLVKRAYPGAVVVGLDADPKILGIARRKAADNGVEVALCEGLATDLPFADGSIDRVLSSLVLHHLTRDEKRRTLAECYRILRPGGELHVADWGRPQNRLMWFASWSVRLLDGRRIVADNLQGRLPQFCWDAGFLDVAKTARLMTPFGTLALLRARKPSRESASAPLRPQAEGRADGEAGPTRTPRSRAPN